MNTYRKTAITVGALFIVCTVASILGPTLAISANSPDYLDQLAGNPDQIITAALLEFIWAAAGASIAIGLYPLLKKYNAALALGSVGFRVVENVFVLIGTLSLLSLLTLSQEFIAAGAPEASSFQTLGTLLLAVRDWQLHVISGLAFSLGVLMYYAILYKSNLIPRWLSGWGVLGAILALAATVLASFTRDFGLESAHTYLHIPIGLQELVFAVWLIAKGFNPSAIAALSAKT
ncbi:MAG TPA: DUF4386 domain-containing protein, partial [Anaerolineales bacterium]|nr:DUF4386 domain-containing protein [Anaerolineales bacterium]